MSPTPATRVIRRTMPPGVRLLLFGIVLYALGALAVLARPVDSPTAAWWPAAGVATIGLLLADRHRRPHVVGVIVLAGTLSNLIGDRSLVAAALLALANTAEAVVVVAVLSHRRPDARTLRHPGDLARMLLAVVLGALTAGLGVGLVAAGLLGGAFLGTTVAIAASHASAVVLLLPFALRTSQAPVEAGRLELLAQTAAGVLITGLIFAPGQALHLSFLVLPVLLWSAMRSSLRATAVQLLIVATLAVVLTLFGGGPFATRSLPNPQSPQVVIAIMQTLAVTGAAALFAVAVVVAERRATLIDVSRREELFRVGFTDALLGLLLLRVEDDELRILELNGVAARMLGSDAHTLIGRSWWAALDTDDQAHVRAVVAAMATGELSGWHGEIQVRTPGRSAWFEISIAPTSENSAAGDLLTVQMADITVRRAAETRLADLALRDGLTGLANRVLLEDRLGHGLAEAARNETPVGVLFLDLDGFKPINDTYGHATGDEVLIQLAGRLTCAVRAVDTVARIGGDEFVIVCPLIERTEDLTEIVDRVRVAVRAPMNADGVDLRLGASIGVALGHAGSDPRQLLRHADAAMYAQKLAARAAPTPPAPSPDMTRRPLHALPEQRSFHAADASPADATAT